MTVERADFPKFFAAVNGGHVPFRWQERLLGTLLADGRWPDRVAAPTGAGKTSAIDVHVFATALTVANGGPRLPRRLAMVVDRRVLVDDQYERAVALAKTLGNRKDQHPLVAEVAGILAGLHTAEGDAVQDAPPLVTARLRGGYVPSRSWVDYPAACAVLCATPDMWGSRLLFGGYGASRLAAPREAGLLAFDSAVMVDEAHLARQLLVTARRVSDLAHVAERPLTEVPALQVIEVSATPAADSAAGRLTAVSVEEDDLAEELLAKRLTRPKPVTLLRVPEWPPGRQPGKAAAAIAQAVTDMRNKAVPAEAAAAGDGARTIGCFVNTVPMAMSVADALRKQDLRVVTVCGQVRPADIARLAGEYPGLLTTRGHDDVDILMTTQSLEVGADLDLAGIVTELATGSALAQRAGRVNRLGKRAEGPVTVIVPDGEITEKTRSGPYSHKELRQALAWAGGLSGVPAGFAPWAIRQSPPPGADPRRMLYQRPELGDAWHWARTSDDLAAPPELELWLADTLEEETSVAIVVRDALPADPAESLEFVRDLPPAPWEAFPVPYRTAQQVLAELLDSGQAPVRVRGDEVTRLRFRPNSRAGTPPRVDIRPGDMIVADSSSEIFTRAADQGFSPQVVAAQASADDADGLDTARRGTADDVLHLHPDPRPGSVLLRIEWSPDHQQVAGFPRDTAQRIANTFADNFDSYTERQRRDILAGLLGTAPSGELPASLLPVTTAAIRLLNGKIKDSDIVVRSAGEEGIRVLVIDNRRAVADEDVRQVFTPRDRDDCPVLLHAHQGDVGARGTRIASALHLPGSLSMALVTAGEHHDDGKADPRFQVHRLGAADAGEPWAKSIPGKTVRQVRQREGEGGLPTGWRHEQRSVVDGWPAVHAVRDTDPDLILRLIGTSHGRGRPGFPHVSAELAGQGDTAGWCSLAADLFDAGAWDELIETTHIRYGVWGCAFLEAVFRAADCQVSREGR